MGADGGLVFGNVRDRNKLSELCKPFWGFTHVEDYHDEYHQEWLDKNDLSWKDVLGTYGTNQDLGLADLKDFVSALETIVVEYGDFTFTELMTVLTDQEWDPDLLYFKDIEKFHFEYRCPISPILKMKISEWCGEIKKAIDLKSIYIVETWT